MPIYEEYAHLYDRSGQLGFSMRMLRYIDQLLELHPVGGKRMLDLACGTGTVAVGMALHGWQVQGVDGSPDMLEEAAAKTPHQVRIDWSLQDMRTLHTDVPVDLLTCLYDSMNYMLEDEDLLSVFRHVYTALKPNGLFIFDMNTAWVLAHHWDGSTFVTDTDELTSIFTSLYDRRRQRATVTVTCFERRGQCYAKSREQHTEQAYPLAQVSNNLAMVGFQVQAIDDCFTVNPASEDNERVLWVARKNAIDVPHYL